MLLPVATLSKGIQLAAQAQQVSLAAQSIAAVSEQNNASTEQVSASAEEMSAQVEEMSAQAEEVVAAAQSLAQMADTLDVFDLDTGKLIRHIPTGKAQGEAVDVQGGKYYVSTSADQMVPEASTSAVVLHHPEAVYYAIRGAPG